MSKKPDGGPAFPQPMIPYDNGLKTPWEFGEGGMSLRDRIAIAALQGIVSIRVTRGDLEDWGLTPEEWIQQRADDAYAHADAMLKARDQ